MATLLITFILIVLAMAALALGWLFTGRSRIARGSCGTDPRKTCGNEKKHCDLCDKDKHD